jgi:hypothetical protein
MWVRLANQIRYALPIATAPNRRAFLADLRRLTVDQDDVVLASALISTVAVVVLTLT